MLLFFLIPSLPQVIVISLQICYCTVLTLLVMMRDDTRPTWWEEVRWMNLALWSSLRLLLTLWWQGLLEHKYCNLLTKIVTEGLTEGNVYSMDMLKKAIIHVKGGTELDSSRFHHAIRMVHNSNLIGFFWEF